MVWHTRDRWKIFKKCRRKWDMFIYVCVLHISRPFFLCTRRHPSTPRVRFFILSTEISALSLFTNYLYATEILHGIRQCNAMPYNIYEVPGIVNCCTRIYLVYNVIKKNCNGWWKFCRKIMCCTAFARLHHAQPGARARSTSTSWSAHFSIFM